MLSREDFYMIKQMRKQSANIVDIATQVGCSERTVRRYLNYPEPSARKTRHKMAKSATLISDDEMAECGQ
jgi:transposase